jgi:hypothetical protein
MTLPATHAHGPGGPRPLDHFHPLSSSEVLERVGEKLRKVRPRGPKGSTTEELPEPAPPADAGDTKTDGSSTTDTDSSSGTDTSSASAASLGPGWVQFASWANDTGKPITYASGAWTVPPAPEDAGDQVIFLFLGLQTGENDGSELFQPVLQWGPSAAGGGKYWSVSCWYLFRGRLVYSPLVRVSAGEVLDTRVERVMQNDQGTKWECVAKARKSGVETSLPVIGNLSLGWVNTTLEAYSQNISCAQFPRTSSTTFRRLTLRSGDAPLAPQWKPTVRYDGCNNQVLIDGQDETRLIYQ